VTRTAWNRRFQERMARSDMSAELFFPLGHAEWKDGRWTVRRDERTETRTELTGVRLRPADPRGEDLAPERQVQGDLADLVGTLRRVRAIEGGGGLVLSSRFLRAKQKDGDAFRRVRFGLDDLGPKGDDVAAARASHRRIRRAVRKSGLAVERPRRFDPDTGLAGLEEWAGRVRLRRRRRLWPWLLPLLLLLLPFLKPDLVRAERFFGVAIETQSLVILLDKSSSMGQHFAAVQGEARNVLTRMAGSGAAHFFNVIAYDQRAHPAFGELRRVDGDAERELAGFLAGLRAGGGTNLRAGLEEAARQVAAHGRPATLLILTDAQDASIEGMLADTDGLLEKFSGVGVVGNALTPRLFGTDGNASPENRHEQDLAALAEALDGRFGRNDSQ